MTMSPVHKRCSALGCHAVITRAKLMCSMHWTLVPSKLQAEVYSSLKAWKDGGSARPYVIATSKAQLAVAEIVGTSPEIVAELKDQIARLEDAQ